MKKRRLTAIPAAIPTAILTAAVLIMACLAGGCSRTTQEPVQEPIKSTESIVKETMEKETDQDTQPATGPPSQEAREIQLPSISKEDYPQVDGSTATLPLSIALYQLVTGVSAEEAELGIVHTKTTNAYNRLIFDSGTELVLAYEPAPSVYELMEQEGVNLIIKPIGKDALVFMANEGNQVSSLTSRQMIDIYTGKIKNWNQVGGADKAIMAFQRPIDSGSQTLMEKLVMEGRSMDPDVPQASVIGEMGELIEAVASYNNEENALGYSVYFYARNMFVKPGLRFMEVDGVLPSNETIKNGTYPYVNEFYAAIREDEPKDSSAYELFEWLTTADGQALVEELGYVGLKEVKEARRLQLQLPEDETAGIADIRFASEERLLLDGSYAYGTSGLFVLNERMEVERVVPGVHINRPVQTVSLGNPLIMESEEGYTGIYSLKSDVWLVPPEYWSIYETADGIYVGNKSGPDGEHQQMVMSWDGQKFDIKEEQLMQTGDKIWTISEQDKTAVITDLQGNVLKEVDFQAYGSYVYGYMQSTYYHAGYQDGSTVLFRNDGEVLFRKEVLGQEFLEQMKHLGGMKNKSGRVTVSAVSSDGIWLMGEYGESFHPFIYNLEQQKVVTKPGDAIRISIIEDENYYIVNGIVHQSDGQTLKASTGKPYAHVLGNGYYAYQDGDDLIVEKKADPRQYRLPVSDVEDMISITEEIFRVVTKNGLTGDGIYRGETCLLEGNMADWWKYGEDCFMLSKYGEHSILVDGKGNIMYESRLPESIIWASKSLVASVRGNYLYITDHKGVTALKLLMGYMGND